MSGFVSLEAKRGAGRRFIFNLALCAALIFFSGCGYHLRGGGDTLPEDVRTVALIPFVNKTYDAEIELLLSSALAAEFSKGTRLTLVSELEADAIVSGLVLSIKDAPVSFIESDVASEYRITLKVDVVLTRENGDIIWKGKGVEEVADYQSVLGNIEETGMNRDAARGKLALEMADRIYDRMFEGF